MCKDAIMAFFTRELGPVERFTSALRSKQAERKKLADQLTRVESQLADSRNTAARLAMAGAGNARLERAEAKLRMVEDRAKMLRASLAEIEGQINATERALTEAMAQQERDSLAQSIESLAVAIDRAVPEFVSGTAALINAVASGTITAMEASRFSNSITEVRQEVLAAADLVCWELRTLAAQTRAGNANVAPPGAWPQLPQLDRQWVYTLNPLQWQDGTEIRRSPAFAVVELPRSLLEVALRHKHVDHLNARRVQTLMHVHGSDNQGGVPLEESAIIDLDALLRDELSEVSEVRLEADVA